jgi:hypothetical protein
VNGEEVTSEEAKPPQVRSHLTNEAKTPLPLVLVKKVKKKLVK